MKHIFKEIASGILLNGKRFINAKGTVKKNKDIMNELDANGYALLPNYLGKEICESLVNEMNQLLLEKKDLNNYWTDYNGSDQRFYRIQEITEKFNFFLYDEVLSSFRNAYMGHQPNDKVDNLLVNKISYVENNLGSGGGWHRDSPHSNQFKAITYLKDVKATNGPFQYVKGSHKFTESLKLYFNKLINDSQYRFTDAELENIITQVGHDKLITFTCNAGDVILVDTKGLHRGKPIENDIRYAMTIYYNDSNF